jgi:uncharacterized membrane protein YfhO
MGMEKSFGEVAWLDESSLPATRFPQTPAAATRLTVREVGTDLLIEADVRERALVATSIPDWPGWRAREGGADVRVVTVDHAFVGFWLPAGRHSVRLRYAPGSFRAGLAIAAAGALGAVLFRAARRRRLGIA